MKINEQGKELKEIIKYRHALTAIEKALSEGKDQEYHTAREFLDQHEVFHGDLSGERVLLRVAQVALGYYEGK